MASLPGITSSWTRHPPEDGKSAANYKVMDADSGGTIKMSEQSS
jgi:hypothetical protein